MVGWGGGPYDLNVSPWSVQILFFPFLEHLIKLGCLSGQGLGLGPRFDNYVFLGQTIICGLDTLLLQCSICHILLMIMNAPSNPSSTLAATSFSLFEVIKYIFAFYDYLIQ